MSVKKTIEIEALVGDAVKQIEGLTKQVEKLEDQLKDTNKSTKTVAKGVQFIGASLKAAGIGLAIAAFTKLTEVFNQNQKVTNIFNTTFEALSLAFNDFFNFLDRNIGTATGFIESIFGNVIIKNLTEISYLIGVEIFTRVKNLVEGIGGLGSALVKVFEGDFAGASEAAKGALSDFGDAIIGNKVETLKMDKAIKDTANAIVDYTKSTVKAAAATVDLNRKAEVGIAQNRIILEQKDREAEKLRQIRDDESKTIDERIKANNDLAAVLDEQEKLMLANADAVIAAAQAQFDKNDNDENQIALLEARAEREGILAQIEGFRSEQLMNINSLERERKDIEEERAEKIQELLGEEEISKLERLEKDKEIALAELDLLNATEEEKAKVRKKYEDLELAQKEALERQKLQVVGNALGSVAQLLGENSAAGKAAAIAQAVINSYLGFTEVLKTPSTLPQPFATIEKIASAGAVLASGLATVKQITAVQTPRLGGGSRMGGSTGGGRAAAPAPPTPPSFNVVGAAPENQLAEALGDRDKQPVKAYVVSNEVTSAQALDRNIVETASIG